MTEMPIQEQIQEVQSYLESDITERWIYSGIGTHAKAVMLIREPTPDVQSYLESDTNQLNLLWYQHRLTIMPIRELTPDAQFYLKSGIGERWIYSGIGTTYWCD